MGGSSGQVIGYQYFTNFLLFIGNPIEKMLGINFDKRGWINPLVEKNKQALSQGIIDEPYLYGENEGGVAGVVHARYGTDDQKVVPFYQEYMESKGLQASAYPFQSYLAFKDFYVGNSGYIKEMLLWPKRIHVRNDGREQWYEVRDDGAVVCEIGEMVDLRPYWNQPYVSNNIYETGIHRTWTYEYKYSSQVISGVSERDAPDVFLSSYSDDVGTIVASGEIDHNSFSNGTSHYIFDRAGLIKVTAVLLTSSESENIRIRALEVYDYKELKEQVDGSSETRTYFEFYAVIGFDELGNPPQIFIDVDAMGTYGGYLHQMFLQGVTFQYLPRERGYRHVDYSDINPIHKIREILTDDTAMNKPESSVNNDNFIKAADRIYDEGLGISWSITEKSCIDAINELCYHIEAGIRVNRQTGLYEMVLFRDDWFEENEIHTIAENKIKKGSMQYEITNADEVINQVNVNYYDRANTKNSSFSISESGLIQTLGQVNAETVDFPYFMNMRNAEIVANWKLKILSTGVLKGSFTTGWREARKWNRYDLIRLVWSKRWTGTILVRIMSIKLGAPTSNEVSIEWVEVVPSTGMMNTTIVADTPVDTAPEAPKPCNAKVFELPYLEAVQAFGERQVTDELNFNNNVGYICAIAEKPQNNSLNAALHVDGGNGFERVATVNYCETAYLDQAIDRISSSFMVKNVGNIASIRLGSQIFINDETMVYQSYDTTTKVLTVKRGVLDTVPQNHHANSILYFADDFVSYSDIQYAEGESIDAKVLTTTPSGILSLSDTATQTVLFDSRLFRPYPPANVKINTQYFPVELLTDFVQISWVDRNRTQQTGGEILGWFDSGVTIEEGVTYHLNIVAHYSDNTTSILVDQNIGAVNEYLLDVSAQPMSTLFYRIKLAAIRNNYECHQPFEFDLMTELLAPVNLHAEVFVNG